MASLDISENTFARQQEEIELTEGNFNFGIQIENKKSNRGGVLKGYMDIRDFSGDTLLISDVQFSLN